MRKNKINIKVKKEINVEELKTLQVNILIKIDEFCKQNNLSYSLAYGTLIGAVRHKGYIPWDDDIDIEMPRPDYDRFIQSFNGTYSHLYVLSPEIDVNFYAPYANVCDNRTMLFEGTSNHRNIEMGIKIDIFPIDGTPHDYSEYISEKKKLDIINDIMYYKRVRLTASDPIKSLYRLLKKIRYFYLSYENLQKRIMQIIKKYPYSDAEFVDNMAYDPALGQVPKCDFEDYIDLEFEGYYFKCIKNFDSRLKKLYGDYMVLPPEGQRISRHSFSAYWK